MPIYGNPTAKIVSDLTNKTGVRTIVYSRLWIPSKAGLSPGERAKERPTPPDVSPLLAYTGEVKDTLRDGYYESQWTAEGGEGSPRESSNSQSFEPRFEERSLALHPNWVNMARKYLGSVNDGGQINWNRSLSGADTAKFGLKPNSGSKADPNPMYGRQTYYALTGGVYSFRYSQSTKPTNLYADIQKIVATAALPGRPPGMPNRNWLKIQPKETLRGTLWEIEEIFWLSDEGGWPTQIYLLAGQTIFQ